jgi:hypothetical protein
VLASIFCKGCYLAWSLEEGSRLLASSLLPSSATFFRYLLLASKLLTFSTCKVAGKCGFGGQAQAQERGERREERGERREERGDARGYGPQRNK